MAEKYFELRNKLLYDCLHGNYFALETCNPSVPKKREKCIQLVVFVSVVFLMLLNCNFLRVP